MRAILGLSLLVTSVLALSSSAQASRYHHGWPPSGREIGPTHGYYPECDGNSWSCDSGGGNYDRDAAGPWVCYSRSHGYHFSGTGDDIYGAAREAQAACIEASTFTHECEPAGCRRY